MEKRKFNRFKSSDMYNAKFILAEDTKIKNLNFGGILLETTKHLNVNNSYRIQITSLNKKKSIMPLSMVLRSFIKGTTNKGDDTLPLYEVALKFIELNDSEKYFLEHIVRELAHKTKTGKLGIKKQYLKTCPECKVTFTFPRNAAPDAQKVTIVGDFNGWDKEDTLMTKFNTGDFVVTLGLETGREYRYRYLVDGSHWENDWCADKYVPNSYGCDDSVVVV